jgi:mannose-6-phosphate isomerase-like protein (cupin superfamily)
VRIISIGRRSPKSGRHEALAAAYGSIRPDRFGKNYVHSTDKLLMLIEGALELEMQGQTFRPAIGKEVLIPAHTNHTVRNIGRTTAKWLYGYKS